MEACAITTRSRIQATPCRAGRRLAAVASHLAAEQAVVESRGGERRRLDQSSDDGGLVLHNIAPGTPVPGHLMARLEELHLVDQAKEMDAIGYTIVRNAIPLDLVGRLKALIKRAALEQSGLAAKGEDINLDTNGAPGSDTQWVGNLYLHSLLYTDPAFEEILAAPKPLALIDTLLGRSALLASMGTHFKSMGGGELPLHTDNGNGMIPPFRQISEVANINYALVEYSREQGGLGMLPGSHLWCRRPNPGEAPLETNPDVVAVDLHPGDCVVWHGNSWHGSFNRTVPGIRMNLAMLWNRQYIVTQEDHSYIPDDVRERHADDQRLLNALGDKQAYGWRGDQTTAHPTTSVPRSTGPDYRKMGMGPQTLYD